MFILNELCNIKLKFGKPCAQNSTYSLFTHTHTHTHTQTCIHTYIQTYIYVYIRVYMYIDMCRLTTGYVLRNASLVDFVVVRTSQSVRNKRRQYSPLHTYAIRCSLLLLGYKPVQHVNLLNTAGD
jgi:hypothetical protein